MFKSIVITASLAFVPVLGLVSCSPENKSQDVYQPGPTQVDSRDGGKSGLKDWHLGKVLDLQDRLDFTHTGAASVRITSRCVSGLGEESRNAETFAGALEVAAFRFLPEEVLLADLKTTPVSCALELQMQNAAGSIHIYTVPSVTLAETSGQPVHVAHEPTPTTPLPPGRLRLDLRTLEDVRIRYAAKNATEVAFACSDLSLAPMPFDQVIQMAQFDFANPPLRPGRTADVLQNRPVQLCRALVTSHGERVEISDLVELRFENGPLPVTLTAGPTAEREGLAQLVNGQPTQLAQWTIANPNPFRRYIRFAKQALHLTTNLVYNTKSGRLNKIVGVYPWARLTPAPDPGQVVAEDAFGSTVTLEPHAQLKVNAVLAPGGTIKCKPAGLVVVNVEAMAAEELAASGRVLAHLAFPVPVPVAFAPDQDISLITRMRPWLDDYCSWP